MTTAGANVGLGYLGTKQRNTTLTTGTIEMAARLYQPQIGRFLQTDPIYGGSANMYDYANQDPANQDDLTGLAGGAMGHCTVGSPKFRPALCKKYGYKPHLPAGATNSLKNKYCNALAVAGVAAGAEAVITGEALKLGTKLVAKLGAKTVARLGGAGA